MATYATRTISMQSERNPIEEFGRSSTALNAMSDRSFSSPDERARRSRLLREMMDKATALAMGEDVEPTEVPEEIERKVEDNAGRIRRLEDDVGEVPGGDEGIPPQEKEVEIYTFGLMWKSFFVTNNGENSATVGAGSIDFLGRNSVIDVAETDVELSGSVCWVCIQHEWGTNTATPVVITGSSRPTSSGTHMNWVLSRFTSTDGGTTYERDFGDIRWTGDIVLAALI